MDSHHTQVNTQGYTPESKHRWTAAQTQIIQYLCNIIKRIRNGFSLYIQRNCQMLFRQQIPFVFLVTLLHKLILEICEWHIHTVCLHTYTHTHMHNYNKTISDLYFCFRFVDILCGHQGHLPAVCMTHDTKLSLCRQAYGYRTEFNVLHAHTCTEANTHSLMREHGRAHAHIDRQSLVMWDW